MELLKDISLIISLIISSISLLTIFTKWGNNILNKSQSKTKESLEKIESSLLTLSTNLDAVTEVSRQQCRNTIKNIYFKYCQNKQIPLFELRTVEKTYDIYSNQLKGNSYVKTIYDEIKKWNIIPTMNFDDSNDHN